MAKRKIQHPGYACCDLAQDLPGWLRAQRAAVEAERVLARTWRAKAEQADKAALAGAVRSAGWAEQGKLEDERQVLHGQANYHAQRALIREGHLDRVEAAHLWRPDMQAREVATDADRKAAG